MCFVSISVFLREFYQNLFVCVGVNEVSETKGNFVRKFTLTGANIKKQQNDYSHNTIIEPGTVFRVASICCLLLELALVGKQLQRKNVLRHT